MRCKDPRQWRNDHEGTIAIAGNAPTYALSIYGGLACPAATQLLDMTLSGTYAVGAPGGDAGSYAIDMNATKFEGVVYSSDPWFSLKETDTIHNIYKFDGAQLFLGDSSGKTFVVDPANRPTALGTLVLAKE